MAIQTPTRPAESGKRRDRLRAQSRQEILDAARRILRDQGIKELSMRGLAHAVGSSPATIYDYFENKEGVLDALFQQGAERLLDAFQEAVSSTEPGLSQLRQIALAYRAFAHDEPDLFQLIFGRVDRTYCPNEVAKARGTALFDILVAAVEQAEAVGQLRQVDPVAAALSAWAAVHGFVTLEINGYLDEECGTVGGDAMFETSLRLLFEGFSP
ncbi:MAG TPA: TetR/AcrR family transcriptional regulator [Thermomicrobiales bacterium]|nr:TetR/AcrR family transcriptional regulator [Thermomicrobiales bacterium]